MPSIDRDFGELYVRMTGDGGEPIIFLHEYFGTHQSWMGQLAEFGRSFRVLAPDLRGHGRSPIPRGERIRISGIASDVHALRDKFGLGAVHIIGCSLGAVAAMHLALDEPRSIRSLTLTSVPSLDSPDATTYARDYIDRVFPRLESSLDRAHGDGDAAYARNVLLHNFAMDLEERPADHQGTTASAEQIDVPVLVVCGERDPVFPPHAALAMAGRMPNASLAVLPASGHLMHQELPGIFNSLVIDHMMRSTRDRGVVSA